MSILLFLSLDIFIIDMTALFAHLGHSSVLTSLTEQNLTPTTFLIGLIVATGFGAFHALSPGHGKTLVSSYLIGTNGTAVHALILGLTVSLTHTLGIIILGVISLFASQYLLPEQLYPILSIISGVIVLGVGIRLLYRRLSYKEQHNDHCHHHHHHHHHNYDEPVTPSSLIALGIAGGLVPCPSALVMLLSAIALHKIGYGLLLTSGFSLGLASVLVILGLLTVYAQQWFEGLSISTIWVKNLSVVSAVFVVCMGIGLTTVAILGIQ